jgi:molybdate transport system substrate-binding protein
MTRQKNTSSAELIRPRVYLGDGIAIGSGKIDLLRPLLLACLLLFGTGARADQFIIAAASDLRFALNDIIEVYRRNHPEHELEVVYGSSGKMTTQIINGAPYDIFFSADISFAERLSAEGFTATDPAVYAIGRIVLWSNTVDASKLRFGDLVTDPRIRRMAIAQPSHAPYGLRAQEALQATGVWERVQPKLVFGENIAHTAQMVESGAADVGIIALSLAKFPEMARHPDHLIDEKLHNPLTQSYIITKHGGDKQPVANFARYMATGIAHEIMERYGFVMPE